jgi:hypothetical protein
MEEAGRNRAAEPGTYGLSTGCEGIIVSPTLERDKCLQ